MTLGLSHFSHPHWSVRSLPLIDQAIYLLRFYYRAIMSQSTLPSTPSSLSSSNFRTIFVAALEKYREKTKTDLLTHPLATQLQSCNSSSDILAVLNDKVNEFEQSRNNNERLSSWLNPTINVIYAFSATLGGGAGLVCLEWSTWPAIRP
jgi:hypothetical protein